MRNKIVIMALMLMGITACCKGSNSDKIDVGDSLPIFTLKDDNSNSFSTESLIGQPAVIYFYPKDDTYGCTAEACGFRDEFEAFKNLNVKIVGISKDSPESHKDFKKKYNLPFTLLSDNESVAHKLFFGKKSKGFKRVTFVIDSNGKVVYVFKSMINAKAHIRNALNELKELDK